MDLKFKSGKPLGLTAYKAKLQLPEYIKTRIAWLLKNGMDKNELSDAYSISLRTVQRINKKYNKSTEDKDDSSIKSVKNK